MKIGADFKALKQHASRSAWACDSLSVSGNDVSSHFQGLKWLGRFQKIFHDFCNSLDGTSTVFPGTATDEADFSMLQAEKDVSRTGLTTLSSE